MTIDIVYYVTNCVYAVAVSTMLAIVDTESRGNPLAIGLNSGQRLKYMAQDIEQAALWVDYLEMHNYNFDVGLAQINIKNIHKYGYRARDMLQPCTNLKVASHILWRNYQAVLPNSASVQDALYKALSAYNTGSYKRGFTNGYVQKVLNNARKLRL
jgi:type IV secretion system protein VirB1